MKVKTGIYTVEKRTIKITMTEKERNQLIDDLYFAAWCPDNLTASARARIANIRAGIIGNGVIYSEDTFK